MRENVSECSVFYRVKNVDCNKKIMVDAKADAQSWMVGGIACGTSSSDESESNLWAMAEDGEGVGRAATVKLSTQKREDAAEDDGR